MKAWLSAAVLLAMALLPSPAHAQDTPVGRLRANFSVLGFERPLRTEDGCRARPEQQTCLLGNGAIVWLDDRESEQRAIAYVLTAHHVLRALCLSAAQNADISAFGGSPPMVSAPVRVIAASCQNVSDRDDPDIAVVQIDISQLRYPPPAAGATLPPPPRPVAAVQIGPTLRTGASYRAVGFNRDRRALDYEPKPAERIEPQDSARPWEFYIRVASNPGASGSPVLVEQQDQLYVVGVIARDPPPERCAQSPDSGPLSDLQLGRCEIRENKINWLVSIGVELQRSRIAMSGLPIDQMNVDRGRQRIDAIRRYYDNLINPGASADTVYTSLRVAFSGPSDSLAHDFSSWGAYFRSLSAVRVTRLLAYWEERFPDCLVPEAVALQFEQISSSIYSDEQIERLIEESNTKCAAARVRALQTSTALLERLPESVRNDREVTAFARDIGDRFDLSDRDVLRAARDRNLTTMIERADRERFTE